MKAVIYARYSSDNQREESIEGQIRECTAFAEKNGITILRHYIDRAFSAKTDNRPEFQNMIKDSGKRLFDMIIVWKLDRFARNRYDSARYKAALKKNGVKVVSATEVISDGAEGIILESVLEGYAEYYSADLSEKVVRGMTENALKSKYNGGTLPIGYQIDSDQCFQLDPLTAPFVREAFQRYDEGATMTQIRDWLNEQGVKNTRGQKMTYNSIQHLLNNRRYIGEYTYRDIVVPDGIPAIVPQDLFDRVQEKLAKNKKAPARHKAEDDYLLTTKLFCGYCGAYLCGESGTSHTGNVHHYYKCVSVKKKRTECHKKSVRKEWIEDLVVSETMKMVMDDKAIEAIVSMLMDLQDRENVNLPLYEQQLREADTAIQNLLNAIQQGILTKSTKGRLEELEATKEELETKIACEKLAKPKVNAEFMTFWLHRFRKLDVRQKSHRKILIDTFINAIFLYDDKMVITFNYKEGTTTITFDDLKTALADQKTGSDLDCSTAPKSRAMKRRFHRSFLVYGKMGGYEIHPYGISLQKQCRPGCSSIRGGIAFKTGTKTKRKTKLSAVVLGQLVSSLPLIHGVLQAHALGHGVAAAGVDGLDFFHLLAGQAVALHGNQSGGPCHHRNDAEQHDDHHIHTGGVGVILGGQGVQTDKGHGNTDNRGRQAGYQLIHKAEQRTHNAGDILTGTIGLVVGAVGHHRDGHIGSGVVCAVADAEEEDEQHSVQVDGQTVLPHQAQMEGVTVTPQGQQDEHADIADQRHADILGQAGLLALLLAGADRQQEERHAEHIAQHHHGQIQAIVSPHHAAVEHTENRGVVGDGQRQFGAGARNHQALHRLVFLDNLQILADLDLLGLFAADTEVLGLILLPDADDGKDGQRNGHHDANRCQRTEEACGGIAALKILGEDGREELHNTHTQQRADGVENREQRTLLGVIGQNGLAGARAAGLEGVADNPDEVQPHEGGIPRPHHGIGNHGGDAVQHQNTDGHNNVADGHERAELAEPTVGAVHQRTDDGVSDGIAQAHGRDHDRSKQRTQRQYIAAKGSNVGKHQYIVYVSGTVVQREKHQLIEFGAVDARCLCIFTHGLLLVVGENLLKSPRRGRRGAYGIL